MCRVMFFTRSRDNHMERSVELVIRTTVRSVTISLEGSSDVERVDPRASRPSLCGTLHKRVHLAQKYVAQKRDLRRNGTTGR